jgi:hypothetical protein
MTTALAFALAALAVALPTAQASTVGGGTAAPSGTATGTGSSSGSSGGSSSASTTSTSSSIPSTPAHDAGPPQPTPAIIRVDCYRVGKTSCHKKKPRTVEIGGELVVHGHNLTTSLTVYFPRPTLSTASTASVPVGARLRPTRHGWAVTIPAGVKSGRIYLETRSGKRSKRYGPVTILASPAAPRVATPLSPSAFDGTGMWIWYLDKSDDGNLTDIAAAAKAAGITTLFIKSSDGTNFWSQFTPALVQSLHALGLNVCAWQYVYGADPVVEAALGAQAVADGADCLVIDAEGSYQGNYYGAQTYIDDLRASIGASYPVGLSSFPYVNEHESEPYSVFLGPGGAQYDVPQVYWHAIGTTPAAAYAQTYIENRIYGVPIIPTGQTYGGVSTSQITQFRQLAAAYGAMGFSWYSWQATSTAGWSALDAPLTPGTGITIPTAWPTLGLGSTGDQVIWMQEHLAAAEPTTPTTGSFDATTEANLLSFQAAHGLPQSGVTDGPTWTALLALIPVTVQWPAPPPSGASGNSGASGASGASGTSGNSGSSGSSGGTGAGGGTPG